MFKVFVIMFEYQTLNLFRSNLHAVKENLKQQLKQENALTHNLKNQEF